MTWNVLIPDRLKAPADVEQEVLGPGARIVLPGASRHEDIPKEVWAAADAILAWHDIRIPAEVVDMLDRCRVIVRYGVGCDNVDLAAAAKRGIPVCNVPDYGTTDVADHAMALALTLARGLPAFSEAVRASGSNWTWDAAGPLRRLAGGAFGVIGLGPIGTATAMRARAFQMDVVAYDPYVPAGIEKALGIRRALHLEELLGVADIVSLHVPLTPETRGMADDRFFAALKPGAILVNTARGGLVVTDALERALRSGRLRGAGLDVLEKEPLDPAHSLVRAWRAREPWIADRLVLTPHAAFVSVEAYRELRSKAAAEARRVLEGQTPRHCVNGVVRR